MFVLSPDEMKKFDRITSQEIGLESIILMENAGKKSAEIIKMEILDEDDSIAVVCGTGNNGGDGFVIARWLFNDGYDVCCYIIGEEKQFSSLAKQNYDILKKINCGTEFINDKKKVEKFANQLLHFDVVVDAIFGIGLSGAIRDFRKDVIDAVNNYANLVVAIDIPSGVNAGTGKVGNIAVEADYTITMADLKYGQLLFPGRELCGETYIVDIGISPQTYADNLPMAEVLTDISEFFSAIKMDSHKGDFGKVGLIAGSPGLTGAGIMAAKAALEMGSGLITVLHPKSLSQIFETSLIEVMTKELPETSERTISLEANPKIIRQMADENFDAMAIGPGISRNEETAKFVRYFLTINDKPSVIDADAINSFEHHSDVLMKLRKKPYIFTPHIKEFSRLIGIPINKIQKDEVKFAVEFAKKYKLVLLLKGSTSIITDGEQITFNITGNSGLSTGGSGDVLTGIILSLLGQNFSAYDAARVGAYIHGRTAEILAGEIGVISITPTKLIKNIYRCLKV